ncbi:hypothetical protein ACH5RR_033772 [Cinchona calisaya]|uniref:Uncharacterized protein n=1 Tax=Cinchona calisaya TaxID=153742 RepID=A0ABD2Y8Y6_9GENT
MYHGAHTSLAASWRIGGSTEAKESGPLLPSISAFHGRSKCEVLSSGQPPLRDIFPEYELDRQKACRSSVLTIVSCVWLLTKEKHGRKKDAESGILSLEERKEIPSPPAFKNDEYEVREAAGTMDHLTPNWVAFPGLVGVACRAFSSVAGFGGPKLTWLRQKASALKARLERRPSRICGSRSHTLIPTGARSRPAALPKPIIISVPRPHCWKGSASKSYVELPSHTAPLGMEVGPAQACAVKVVVHDLIRKAI